METRTDKDSILVWFQNKSVHPKQILKKRLNSLQNDYFFTHRNNTNKLPLIPKTTKHDYKLNRKLLNMDSEIEIEPFHISRSWSFGILEFEKTKELEVGV